MSELEYEKAARGTRSAVPNEGAWGTPFVGMNTFNITDVGEPNSMITNLPFDVGNANTSTQANRPLRCGIFAASAINKTREETGGSYYGVMELSGNLSEPIITVGRAEGRNFNGANHGDGVITFAGEGNVATWPLSSPNAGAGLYATGTGFKGGGFGNIFQRCTISNRFLVNSSIDAKFGNSGMRLVRTAP